MGAKDFAREVLDLAQKMGADQAEVFYTHRKSLEVLIEKNDIQIPKADLYEGVGIRVLNQQKIGFASTNVLEEESLKQTITGAIELANSSPEDKFNSLPQPQKLTDINDIYDYEGAEVSLQELINYSQEFMEQSRGKDQRVTIDKANFKAETLKRAIATSKGINAEDARTVFENQAMGFARDGDDISSFDIEYQVECHLKKMNFGGNGQKLREKLISTLGALTIPSFKGEVILSPFAAATLVMGPILFAVNAENVLNGISPWGQKLEQKVAVDALTFTDNAYLPGSIGSKMFDREGQPPQKLNIVQNGQLQNLLYNHYAAVKSNKKSTGHAAGSDQSLPQIGATNAIIAAGEKTLSAIIQSIDKGLLVTRYSGSADPVSGDFSGVVKGGHLIEKGQLIQPVKEVMISGNIYQLLNQIAQISKDFQTISSYQIPYLQISDVSVTGS